jgi:DNA-binding transcriptional regulator GbsR (MarR family)
MKLKEGREQFIQAWGSIGSSWGINRTMAQVHALLLISPDTLSAEDIMESLSISRGNANMNIRGLMDWGLVFKVFKPGERREFFIAEKDMWKVARQVAKERKKRELEPLIQLLDQLKEIKGDNNDQEYQTFSETVTGIRKMAKSADKTLETLIKADENWFLGPFMKLIK